MKKIQKNSKKFLKTIAILKRIGYNKYIKVVKSGANTVKSGVKGEFRVCFTVDTNIQ